MTTPGYENTHTHIDIQIDIRISFFTVVVSLQQSERMIVPLRCLLVARWEKREIDAL